MNQYHKKIDDLMVQHIHIIEQLRKREIHNIEKIIKIIVNAISKDHTLFIFGNGGSAADAQHIAGEFVNKLKIDRRPLPAIALTTDTSIITAIANDSGYRHVFERQIAALGKKGDVALAITTSDFTSDGHSIILKDALMKAKEKEMITIGFVSDKSKNILSLLDEQVVIPDKETPRIQETQILVAHIICELVEEEFYKEKIEVIINNNVK